MSEIPSIEDFEKAIADAEAGLETILSEVVNLVDCLSDMTEHYVQLAGCGDCGNWDPEKESEVIAARRMIAEWRDALKEDAPSA